MWRTFNKIEQELGSLGFSYHQHTSTTVKHASIRGNYVLSRPKKADLIWLSSYIAQVSVQQRRHPHHILEHLPYRRDAGMAGVNSHDGLAFGEL